MRERLTVTTCESCLFSDQGEPGQPGVHPGGGHQHYHQADREDKQGGGAEGGAGAGDEAFKKMIKL